LTCGLQGSIWWTFIVFLEEWERFHQLIALWHGQVGVIKRLTRFAIRVEPPIALQYRLIEKRTFGTQKRLHHKSIICQCAHMKHLWKIFVNDMRKISFYAGGRKRSAFNVNLLLFSQCK
jgi:hypothetical protein